MSRTGLATAVALCLSALVGGGCIFGGGGSKQAPVQPTAQPTQSPSTGQPEAALARYVETTFQKQYVEDCSKADVAKDVNKTCSAFRGERGQQRAYVLGQTFSEFTDWAIVENRNGQWSVVATQKISADNAAVPGIPWPLRLGTEVVVTGASPCVNVREGPSLNQKAVDCIRDGTTIRLTAGPTQADNFQWWQVEGRTGWVVGDFLRYPDAAR